jgi:aminoglycoside/choline kinase family phosphotransferase
MDLLGYYFQLSTGDRTVGPEQNHSAEPADKKEWALFQESFREASAQRLMQALGAYGFLGLKRGMPEFLSHIPNGIKNLIDASNHAKHLPLLNRLARTSGSILQNKD